MNTEQTIAVRGEQAVALEPRAPTVLEIIQSAVLDPRVDPDKLERLLAIQERFQANQARAEYNIAMAACQAELPAVVRDARNESNNSRYARLETVIAVIKPVIARHGFSVTHSSGKPEVAGNVCVVCHVRHSAGDTESFPLECAPDTAGPKGGANKTTIQGIGATISYLRRYMVLMAFNVAIANEDNDGQRPGWVTEQQVDALETLIAQCATLGKPADALRGGFLKAMGAKLVGEIHARDFQRAVTLLEGKKRELATAATTPKSIEDVDKLPDAVEPVLGTQMRCKGVVHEVYADAEGIQRWRKV